MEELDAYLRILAAQSVMEVPGVVDDLICLYAYICYFRYKNTSIILDLLKTIYN